LSITPIIFNAMEKTVYINKEEIGRFRFSHREVLQSPEAVNDRMANLERAMILGNADHCKVKITFEAEEGLKQVETTVWATTKEDVTLKGGVIIPIRCIHEVIIY
jgi:hypothetical protein